MAEQRPDFSFERQGRLLEAWLPELVSEDAPTRRAAGEALQAMMYGVPSVHTDLADIEWGSSHAIVEQGERFQEAVRATVRSPGFAGRDFVRKLILYRIALKDDWLRRCDRAQEPDRHEERVLQRLQAADGDVARIEAARRYLRWLCASLARSLKRGNAAFVGAESLAAPGLMAAMVFNALDVSLLADRPGLHPMLADDDLRYDATRALARIGPPAVDFAPLFFEQLDAGPPVNFSADAQALGSIGRDDPDVVDGLLRRLRSGPSEIRAGAAAALFHMGPSLAGRLEVALDLLLGASYEPELVCAVIPALASVGRDSEVALRRVVEVAEPRPPRWRADAHFPDSRYDEVMFERGVAIDALGQFQRFADRVVPVLVDAFDTFEEYDPDWSYRGEHERVCAALESFGVLAAPIVPRLVRFLEEWPARPEGDREWPSDVFRLLAAIGPPAGAAMPALRRLRAMFGDDVSAPGELSPDDELDRAMINAGGA